MKKIVICIPSYNESENIENITLKIDKSFDYFAKNFIVEIINCDNNSPDLTNKLFESVKTKHKKVSIVTSAKGKGINLLNFFEYFLKNNFDYGFTIDADLNKMEILRLINENSKYFYVSGSLKEVQKTLKGE